jgi:hypothetical protein
MRCWKLPNARFLVEDPSIPRITTRDPLPQREHALLLQEVNARIQQTGQNTPIENFQRYYELNEEDDVCASYEEYGFSMEDDMYSWSYLVIGDTLWEFRMTHANEHPPKLEIEAVQNGLVPTK